MGFFFLSFFFNHHAGVAREAGVRWADGHFKNSSDAQRSVSEKKRKKRSESMDFLFLISKPGHILAVGVGGWGEVLGRHVNETKNHRQSDGLPCE